MFWLEDSATGRSYTQNFWKVRYINIIQAIVGRKLMKDFTVTDHRVYKAFDHKK